MNKDILADETKYLNTLHPLIEADAIALEKVLDNVEETYMKGLRNVEPDGSESREDILKRLANYVYEKNYMEQAEILKQLKYLIEKPYFGRIVFQPKKGDKINVTLGRYAYFPNDNNYKVVDWRAPIASLYYDNLQSTKNVSFKNPNSLPGLEKKEEIISGDLVTRRSILIEKKKILRVQDTTKEFDILEHSLGTRSGGKLEDIIQTIQAEQNVIIRENPNKVLITQGVAGSGKTTIALHRLSYLLYNYTNLNQDNMLFVINSQILRNYLKDALDDFGYKDSHIKSVNELIIEGIKKLVPYPIDNVNTSQSNELNEIGRINHLKRYADNINRTRKRNIDKQIFIPNKYIDEVNEFIDNEGSMDVLTKLFEYFNNKLSKKKMILEKNRFEPPKGIKDEIKELHEVVEAINKIIKNTDPYEIYEQFCISRGEIIDQLTQTNIDHLSGIFIVNQILMYGLKGENRYQHIFVDEGQDFGLLQYTLLNMLSGNHSFTILGDLNQSFSNNGNIQTWDELINIFEDRHISHYSLPTSYRSTKEITEFSAEILKKSKSATYLPTPYNRNGKEPIIKSFESLEKMINQITKEIQTKEGSKSVCIIQPDKNKLYNTYEFLNKYGIDAKVITDSFSQFTSDGIYLSGIQNIKGLEFSTVYILNPNDELFVNTPSSINKLYVCCTRAINELKIYHYQNLTDLLA